MQKSTKSESLGVSMAKLILAVSFIVSFGALLGAAGYLSNMPVETKQPPVSFVPEITVLPTLTIKDDSDVLNNFIKPVAEDTEGKTYRNIREGNRAYKLIEIKILGNWRVTNGVNGSFTQSLSAYYPEDNSRLRFNLDIEYDLEANLINNEKEFDAINLSGIPETLMRREITYPDPDADRDLNSIETYIKFGAYYYVFNIVDMDGNKLTEEDRKINDQIISTFKFIETEASDISNLVVNIGESPIFEIKDNLPDDKNYLRDEAPKDLIIKILNSLNAEQFTNDTCKTEEDFIKTFEYGSSSLDLNGDKIKEFIIMPGGVCDEVAIFRGASGNGPVFIWQKTNKVWKEIGDLSSNTYLIKNSKTDSYYDIVTYWHLSAGSGSVSLYQWNKTDLNYNEVFTKVIEW